MQPVVVIQEADHPHLKAVFHARGQLPPCTPRAINQHLRQLAFVDLTQVQATQPDPCKSSRGSHQNQHEQRLNQADGSGNTLKTIKGKERGK